MAESKLGAYFQTQPENRAEGTEIVKASMMKWVHWIDPDSLGSNPFRDTQRVLARLYIKRDSELEGDPYEKTFYMRGVQGARDYAAMLLPRYAKLREMGIFDIASVNEPDCTINTVETLNEFSFEWARIMVSLGMRPWVLSLGSGHPDIGLAQYLVGSIRYACEHGGGFETHEYGAPSVQDGNGWWTLRIKRTLKELYAAGLPAGSARVFIGEGGIDGGMIDWGNPPFAGKQRRRGWKDWTNWVYPAQYGLPQSNMTHELYWRQLSGYDDELCKIPEVVAFTPYIANPQEDWKDFVLDGDMIRKMAGKHNEDRTVGEILAKLGQAHMIDINEGAALMRAAGERDMGPISEELRETIAGQRYAYQGFMPTDDRSVQYWAWCKEGDWSNIHWQPREN